MPKRLKKEDILKSMADVDLNPVDPDFIYIGVRQDVDVVCRALGHEQSKNIADIRASKGCFICGRLATGAALRLTKEQVLESLADIDLIPVDSDFTFTGNGQGVAVICSRGHLTENMLIVNIRAGHGCGKCDKEGRKFTQVNFPRGTYSINSATKYWSEWFAVSAKVYFVDFKMMFEEWFDSREVTVGKVGISTTYRLDALLRVKATALTKVIETNLVKACFLEESVLEEISLLPNLNKMKAYPFRESGGTECYLPTEFNTEAIRRGLEIGESRYAKALESFE